MGVDSLNDEHRNRGRIVFYRYRKPNLPQSHRRNLLQFRGEMLAQI